MKIETTVLPVDLEIVIGNNTTKEREIHMNTTHILARNNLVHIDKGNNVNKRKLAPSYRQLFGTLYSNLAYYGYVLSKEACEQLMKLDKSQLIKWWDDLEPALKNITGDDKKMDDFVVYKNFPKEVLDKSQGEYWFAQILMYLGFPNDLFTEEVESRAAMFEETVLKVLHLEKSVSLTNICNGLLGKNTRWTKVQASDILHLVHKEKIGFDPSAIPFKENMATLVASCIDNEIAINMKSATDVLRLAIAMSDGDVSMVKPTRFKKFARKERRFFLTMLNNATSLEEDMARNKNVWKKFIRNLHPFDYVSKYYKVCKAYDALYNDDIETFNSKVESMFEVMNVQVLDLLKKRPGEFTRRLQQAIDNFGLVAINKYTEILPKLTVNQLLKIQKHIENVNIKDFRTFAPRGNWNKLQVVANDKAIPVRMVNRLLKAIDAELKVKLNTSNIGSVNLSEDAKLIKLQTNDSDLTDYGRGTVFKIPDDVTFLRTASYWQAKSAFGNVWFDNGWNFFDEAWKPVGSCCWMETSFDKAAVFSGDPTNSKEMQGKACQMIDLYLDKLEAKGVRYALWSILCYSHIPFSQATDVFAAFQWGEHAQKGKLFEPSRCQLAFPVDGETFTKYVAYVDIVNREVVYADANLRSSVTAACYNGNVLSEQMPAFVEYLETLPSVFDLFKNASKRKTGMPVAYDDSELEIDGGNAYIFRPVNEENKFNQFDVSKLLNIK